MQTWRVPCGFRRCRLPEFLENGHMNVTSLSPLCVGRCTSSRHHWYLFLLEADSTNVRDFPAATQCLNQLRHRLPHSQYPYAQKLSNLNASFKVYLSKFLLLFSIINWEQLKHQGFSNFYYYDYFVGGFCPALQRSASKEITLPIRRETFSICYQLDKNCPLVLPEIHP